MDGGPYLRPQIRGELTDDDEFPPTQTFLIEQPIGVRSRLDRFAAHSDDAIARFQSGPLTQPPGPHFGISSLILTVRRLRSRMMTNSNSPKPS